MNMFIHFFSLCPVSLTIKLNFGISKVRSIDVKCNFTLAINANQGKMLNIVTELGRGAGN